MDSMEYVEPSNIILSVVELNLIYQSLSRNYKTLHIMFGE